MSDIGDAEIVLLGPEEWDGVKTYAPTQNVACGGLSLALSDYEMLDADALAGEAIRQRAMSPAAKMRGALASRYSSTMTPRSVARPARCANSVCGRTPMPTT